MTQTPDSSSVPEQAPATPPTDASVEPAVEVAAPAADAPVAEAAPVPDEPAEEAVAEEPADETVAADDPAAAAVDEERAAEAVVADEPASETVAADEPADETVAADEPAAVADQTEEPAEAVADEPAAEIVADEPVAEAGATAEPAEGAAEEPVAASIEADAPPAAIPAPTPTPAPRPSPATVRPGPRPVPHPPTHAPTAPAVAAAPVPPPADAAEAAHAATFGSVDDEGNVSVRESAGDRVVGQFPGATHEEALSLYVRRFLDLQAKVSLFEARLTATDLPVKEIDQTLAKLTEELAEPAAVGDLDGLRARLDGLRGKAAERRAAAEAERQAARAQALTARTAIVEQAEKIAATDPSRIQWRPAGEELRALLDQWKEAQRTGPRLDRPTEESLWKRFSHARTTFDRERRHFFAELESRNAGAKAVKEKLVAEAEKLQSSTDWGATAGAFRDLMTQWKAAGRASRADDDALWARFRAAQDTFFAHRDAENAALDAEYGANLQVKEALLVEAEALLPIKDLAAAKAAIRSIQDRWEAAGKVPRGDVQRVEGRLRAVETAIREGEQSQWVRTNPETRARAEGAAAQLEQAIAALEADLAKATAAGDKRRIAEAQAALDARRTWLEQVQRAAQDARG